MIDQKFIQGCTKEQINAGVAWLEAERLGFDNPCEFMILSGFIFKGNEFAFTPCTNPNDAWPIILENKIAIDPLNTGVKWIALEASWSKTGIEAENENPLRAAMEVYLLMSNEK